MNLSNQDLSAGGADSRPISRELPSIDAIQRQQQDANTPTPPQRLTSPTPTHVVDAAAGVASPTPAQRPVSASHDSTPVSGVIALIS